MSVFAALNSFARIKYRVGPWLMARASRKDTCAIPYGKSASSKGQWQMEQFYRMAEEVGFLRHKPGGGRGGKRARPRSPGRADDPSHGAVTREVLDVARYIAGMTAELEAVAIAARLDRLVYFLGMAKVESEMFVRAHGAERAEEESDENNSVD